MFAEKLGEIKKCENYHGKRIAAQIVFAKELCIYKKLDESALNKCVDYVFDCLSRDGAVTAAACAEAEKILGVYSAEAKKITALCVAHAHMDMNWLWGYNETVAIVLATCRTMLSLMREYKDFTFSQSQASVYRIVEEHDPEMLEEIKQRVREGRWEISASTWVENDKNMPDSESQIRQYLCAKKYLSELFEIDENKLNLDFEPDTFGHNANQPEIMRKCGIKYYYHCRGNFAPMLYNWQSESGSRVLVYREPSWYNWMVDYDFFAGLPKLGSEYKINKLLKVYGVGDHGGGATRRDLDRLLDMATWNVMPTVKFSSYSEFFSQFDADNNIYSTVKGEINFIFTGCYTSQSRIKKANRRGEKYLARTENAGAACAAFGLGAPKNDKLAEAWRIQLFNHFHDILPGSGVAETGEFAMGESQRRDALLGVENTRLMRLLADNADTSRYGDNAAKRGITQGAGVGFAAHDMVFAAASASANKKVFLLYNPSVSSEKKIAEIVLWDFEAPANEISFYCGEDRLETDIIDDKPLEYWGHTFRRALVAAEVPACGYACVTAVREPEYAPVSFPYYSERQHNADPFVLENEYLKAEFDRDCGALISLTDKSSCKELINGKACFAFIKEGTSQGMNAWKTGNKKEVIELTEGVNIDYALYNKSALMQTFGYSVPFGRSVLRVKYSLKKYGKALEVEAECDFNEIGNRDYVPALEYRVYADTENGCKYGIPFGVISRPETDEYQAGIRFASTTGENAVALMSDSKYGYKAYGGVLSLALVRSTTEPSLSYENYRHTIKLALAAANKPNGELIKLSEYFDDGLECLETDFHKGNLPECGKWFELAGNAVLSNVRSVGENEVVFRFYGADDGENKAELKFLRSVAKAAICDGLDKEVKEIKVGKDIELALRKGEILTLKLKFA